MQALNQPLAIDGCYCFTVRKAARRISRLYDRFLEPIGLRITQHLILAVLDEVHEASVNNLADRLDLERTAMGKNLTLLERSGLVQIQSSLTDKRSRLATLTPEGKRVFKQSVPLWREAQQQFGLLNGVARAQELRNALKEVKLNGGEAER
ncbi:MarR family winged helix-turn-helix transcriptional regulator [Mesorhizobium calcicola]|uniref:MarR family winged helix-turn-helix transcriptional regulator n=1 Tax=Mesorhizobium calcicola TaxID=1300310 RepID=A0ABW4WNP9_9HYPH